MSSQRQSLSDIVHTFTGTQTVDGDSGIRVAGFLPHSHPLRRSITNYIPNSSGYCNAFPNASTSRLEIGSTPPPSYYDVQDRPLPPPRFKILPREEEGNEQLPAYSCSIHKEAVFYRKMELSTPFDRATKRQWRKEFVVLHGTLLKVHKVQTAPLFGKCPNKSAEHGAERPQGYFPGKLRKSYTLQGAEVGIAADYKKRHFVIRLRVETEQFLLSVKKVEVFMEWLEALSAAVDLSPSLEERSLPKYQTLPRRRGRQGARLVRQQQRIIERQFPHLVEEGDARMGSIVESEHLPNEGGLALGETAAMEAEESRLSMQESVTEADLRDLRLGIDEASPAGSRPSAPLFSRHNRNAGSTSPFHTSPSSYSFTSDGKWSPPHTWTPEANLRYAKRCMAVLCGDAPRHSDYVVCDGKRYKLFYEAKQMVLDEVSSGVVAKKMLLEEKQREMGREREGGSRGVMEEKERLGRVVLEVKGKGKGKAGDGEEGMKGNLPSYEELFGDAVKVGFGNVVEAGGIGGRMLALEAVV